MRIASYVLTVDGESYSMGSKTTHTLELSDGEHTYSVTATDASGNVDSASGSFAMDATAPDAVQVITRENGVAVSWTAVEDAALGTQVFLSVGELESVVKVKLLREERDGSKTQVLSRSVKANRRPDHTLSLTSGTYFVEVASYDNGVGRYNTTYALERRRKKTEKPSVSQ